MKKISAAFLVAAVIFAGPCHALMAGMTYEASNLFLPLDGERTDPYDRTDPDIYAAGYKVTSVKLCNPDGDSFGASVYTVYKAVAIKPGKGMESPLWIHQERSEGTRAASITAVFFKDKNAAFKACEKGHIN